jgi:dUTP pyrophosphatase
MRGSILVKRISEKKPFFVPEKATEGSSGYDIRASLETDIILEPGEIRLISTNFKVCLPDNTEAQIRSRSGLSLKGIVVVNSPGTVDSDYTGEVGVILGNYGKNPATIENGMKIAQMVVVSLPLIELGVTDIEFKETSRGSGGFGSTGLK